MASDSLSIEGDGLRRRLESRGGGGCSKDFLMVCSPWVHAMAWPLETLEILAQIALQVLNLNLLGSAASV
jgi:hypothetical protein